MKTFNEWMKDKKDDEKITKISGGKGDKLKPSDVDPLELKKGIEVEQEHTPNKKLAQDIAMDHLAEDPKYYSKLKKIHKD